MKNIGIVGLTGKMGKEVRQLLEREKDFSLLGGYARKCQGDPLLISHLELLTEQVDCLIDFSSPSLLKELLSSAVKHRKSLIIGTTGYREEEEKEIQQAAREIAIFKSPNFSLGVFVMTKLLDALPISFLKKVDAALVETHHRNKRDSPSGTALLFQDILQEKTKTETPIYSLRLGELTGEHTLLLQGEHERIEIKHEAFSRKAFAAGVISALHFLKGKTKGLYSLDHLFSKG